MSNASDEFYYRRTLLPRFNIPFSCERRAPPVPPNPVLNISIIDASYTLSGSDDVYEFSVQWEPPEFGDRNLEEYLLEVVDFENDENPSIVLHRGSITVRVL